MNCWLKYILKMKSQQQSWGIEKNVFHWTRLLQDGRTMAREGLIPFLYKLYLQTRRISLNIRENNYWARYNKLQRGNTHTCARKHTHTHTHTHTYYHHHYHYHSKQQTNRNQHQQSVVAMISFPSKTTWANTMRKETRSILLMLQRKRYQCKAKRLPKCEEL